HSSFLYSFLLPLFFPSFTLLSKIVQNIHFSLVRNLWRNPPLLPAAIFIIIILVPWESMAAPKTVWYLFLKFGTLIKDSPFFNHTKFHVSHWTTLAPPTGQSWTFVNTVTFEPFDRFSKMRYHWIPWIKTNLTFNGANFRLYRFSVIPGFIKKPLKAYSSYNFGQIFFKITRDDLQTKPHKTYSTEF